MSALVAVGVGGALAASSAVTVQSATNGALRTKIIVNSSGFTLYHSTKEKKGSIGCTRSCRKIWPPLLVPAQTRPVAGAGLTPAKLATIKRPDGGVQVTYNGFALYRYSGDKKAGQANGQGIEGAWYAITPAGTVTKLSATNSGSTTTPASPTTTTPQPTGGGSTGECPAGQIIPQGTYAGDGDEDNTNGGDPSDQDGCL